MKTVLILEDQLELAGYWRQTLEDAGYRVRHARNTEDAITFLSVDPIDVVVTDMLIRDEDNKLIPSGGLSLLGHLNINVKQPPKIIAVSGAHPDLHVLKHAEALGADRCVGKPFTATKLLSIVSELMAE